MKGPIDPKYTTDHKKENVLDSEDRIGTEPEDTIGKEHHFEKELEDKVLTDPEGSDSEEPDDVLLIETDDPDDLLEGEDKDDDNLFAAWMCHNRRPEGQEDMDREEWDRDAAIEERKNSFDRQAPSRADRHQSLPCPAELSAMTQLPYLYNTTMVPSSVRSSSRQCVLSTEDVGCSESDDTDSRTSVIPSTIPELDKLPNIKVQKQFRRRNVMSLCIEEWLWRKQTCPTCCVQLPMPEPVYWNSTLVKVP
ncbi:hypothetical protein UPYG_G00021480 [Umbra pygmaea]|uniref:Uncharacterized protein n=1 Tax=Umbra pygmaea TaxID=75934 RepID=A0ABD0Y4W6_UMBPY